MANFSHNHTFSRPLEAAAAGKDDTQTGAAVDMSGYEGVTFILAMGAGDEGSAASLKAQGSHNNSDWVDLDHPAVEISDDDENGLVILEVYRPLYRYIRPVVEREDSGTDGFALDGIIAIQHGARKLPVTQSEDVVHHVLSISPAPAAS